VGETLETILENADGDIDETISVVDNPFYKDSLEPLYDSCTDSEDCEDLFENLRIDESSDRENEEDNFDSLEVIWDSYDDIIDEPIIEDPIDPFDFTIPCIWDDYPPSPLADQIPPPHSSYPSEHLDSTRVIFESNAPELFYFPPAVNLSSYIPPLAGGRNNFVDVFRSCHRKFVRLKCYFILISYAIGILWCYLQFCVAHARLFDRLLRALSCFDWAQLE